jgi:2-oxoglutarate dehydrogenase E2 component (dihydrolipoamide succinyltransferase)
MNVNLPKLGESIVSATVVQWFKKIGDRVERDEPLLEVSTDKVNSEIPAPFAGTLTEIFAFEGQEVDVGVPLCSIGEGGKEASSRQAPKVEAAVSLKNESLSPAVLRLIGEKGIPLEQIDQIPRTGEGGRLTKRDVEAYRPPNAGEGDRIPMSPLRKAIADNMVRSFYEAPHASLITEVDVTDLVSRIQKEKEAFVSQHGAKLSITAFVARAIGKALHAYPLLNSSLDQETILLKKGVNLGVAVSVEQGVMVPVIRRCHELSLPEIAQRIKELADRARNNRLTPDDVKEGTITLTNFGMTGTLIGIPIIRYPEVAIIGLGAITKRVLPIGEEAFGIRSVMMVSLTFDHRVLDGLYGCGFLAELKKVLEEDSVL